jgi:hypothetical protein
VAVPSDLNKVHKKGVQCKTEKSRNGQLCKIRKNLQPSKTYNVNCMHGILYSFTPSSRFHNPQAHSILVLPKKNPLWTRPAVAPTELVDWIDTASKGGTAHDQQQDQEPSFQFLGTRHFDENP